MIDKAVPQGANGHLDKTQADWLRLMPDGWDGTPPECAADVLYAIDQLRRDLSGYHGQLKAHNDLQRHCDNQRNRIVELEGLYAKAKAEKDETATAFIREYDRAEFLTRERAKLRELVRDMHHFILLCGDTRFCGVITPDKNLDVETFEQRMEELRVEV